jgi:hypothetical protein
MVDAMAASVLIATKQKEMQKAERRNRLFHRTATKSLHDSVEPSDKKTHSMRSSSTYLPETTHGNVARPVRTQPLRVLLELLKIERKNVNTRQNQKIDLLTLHPENNPWEYGSTCAHATPARLTRAPQIEQKNVNTRQNQKIDLLPLQSRKPLGIWLDLYACNPCASYQSFSR